MVELDLLKSLIQSHRCLVGLLDVRALVPESRYASDSFTSQLESTLGIRYDDRVRGAVEKGDLEICNILRELLKSDTTEIVGSLDDDNAEELMNVVQKVRFTNILVYLLSEELLPGAQYWSSMDSRCSRHIQKRLSTVD
jgi:hypothetical protein